MIVFNESKVRKNNEIGIEFLENLKQSWSAEILLNNDQKITIWYTAFPMRKKSIQKVLSVSSDYPKHTIKK